MRKNILIGGAVMLGLGVVGYAVVTSFLAPTAWARDTMTSGTMFCADFEGNTGPGTFAAKLNLTQAQRAQIKSIAENEKPQVAPLVQEIGSTIKQVQTMTDPTQIHNAVDREQPTVANLIVDVVRTKTQIYNNVLTSTQQQQVETMLENGPMMGKKIEMLPTMADKVVSMMAWRLDLSDTQQSQIRSIVDAGVQNEMPQIKQLQTERQAIVDATSGGKFDEAQIQQLAQAPASTATQILGDVLVLKSQVEAILTPAQREKMKQFHEQMRAQHAGHFGFWHGDGGGDQS